MRVKRYVVDTLPDALNRIRQELGKDAVILNTKQLRVGGILGLFGKKKIEVIAAADEQSTPSDPLQQTAASAITSADREPSVPVTGSAVAARAYRRAATDSRGASSETAAPSTAPGGVSAGRTPELPGIPRRSVPDSGALMAEPPGTASRSPGTSADATGTTKGKTSESPRIIPGLHREPSHTAAGISAPGKDHDVDGGTVPVNQSDESSVSRPSSSLSSASVVDEDVVAQFKEAAARSIQRSAERLKGQEDGQKTEDRDRLIAEIREMKELVEKLAGGSSISGPSSEAQMAQPFEILKSRLIGQGVAPGVAEDLMERVRSRAGTGDAAVNEATVRQHLREELLRLFGDNPPDGIADDTRIVHFVGPTGVGKTTTIAKLAAEQVLRRNKKIGFVTSDTYRIAAIDQLKTYGTILNVPVEVVFSPEELEEALVRLSDKELIFMDTAGRNYRDQSSIQDLHDLLAERGQSETYLVLSLVSKYDDIRAIIDNVGPDRVTKVLWTKMDETSSYGSIINVLHEYSIPVSYITNGQNVPDDIALLHPPSIVEQLLGEDAYG